MEKRLEEIKKNLIQDINVANLKEIDKIYSALKCVLKKFDNDSILKNLYDFFKNIFKTKRAKCLKFIDDIYDSNEKLSKEAKEKLRKTLLDISNIHRTFIENIIALLGVT